MIYNMAPKSTPNSWFYFVALQASILVFISAMFKFPFNPGFPKPYNFPKGIALEISDFVNWADEIIANDLWTVYPKSDDEILVLTNWAKDNNFTIRASGAMHSWSPLTVDPIKNSSHDKSYFLNLFPSLNFQQNSRKTILVKIQDLQKIQVISANPEDASFWAQPGILLDDLLLELENHKLGFLHFPGIGDITLGGALAVGTHGTGIPAENETLSTGHTYGSLSNLIIAFTAVVYDNSMGKYVLKDFHRSDTESGAFLANLGKTFLTNVTMRAGPLQHLRCQSITDISAEELFSQNRGLRTISNFLTASGRIEIIWFPFTSNPWLKVWTVLETKPEASLFVHSPYNFPFTDTFPKLLALFLGKFTSWRDNVKIVNNLYIKFIPFGLTLTNSWDIWGTSRNVFNYIRPATLKMTEAGWAVVTSRGHVDKALSAFYQLYTRKLASYGNKNMYPINGPLGIRITGVDNPQDVGVNDAQTCGICSSSPVLNRPDLDTVIWFNVLTFRMTNEVSHFMCDIQNSLDDIFDGTWAVLRVEWSKGFAYYASQGLPWSNFTYLNENIPSSWTHWESTKETLNQFDPFRVFSNKLLNVLFG